MRVTEEGLRNLITGDTAVIDAIGGTHVYNHDAPQGRARPYVVFFHSGGGPENIYPGKMDVPVYLVKAVADDIDTAATIDAKLHDALHHGDGDLTVSGYTPLNMIRTNEVQVVERLQDGRTVYHYGAYYRLRLDD